MDKIPYLLKRNYFSNEQLDLIFSELKFLTDSKIFKSSLETESAIRDGVILKNNSGIFLNSIYKDLNYSPIFKFCQHIFDGDTVEYSELSPCNRTALSTNYNSVLVSHYQNNNYYESHFDDAVVSVLYWFCDEPKSFEGGDLIFTDTNEQITFENNTMIMFPSWALHQVTNVSMNSDSSGRYCVSQFLNVQS